ncbi:MAG: hypothetical protein OSJ43_03860 [Oscillospiraceae bacterium]|nr:hypothetical protein [Oscillospiraceae bacterium]
MNFPRKEWVDEAVQYPDRFSMQTLSGGMVNLTPSPGTVDTVGTPQSAVNFNHLERGILDAQTALSLLAIDMQMQKDMQGVTEVGTVTLKNTKIFPFNNSRATIALKKPRGSKDYGVEIIEATAADGKPIGDIVANARQLNGFALSYSGSASSVTVKYKVTGGITV